MKILLCKSHFAGPVSGSDETLVAYATHLHQQGHSLAVVLLYAPAETDQYYARLKQAENRQRVKESFNSERMCEEATSFLIKLRHSFI